MKQSVLVGTYTNQSYSEGVYRVEVDDNGKFGRPQLVATALDPSYLVISGDGERLYAVCECSDFHGSQNGGVMSFQKNGDSYLPTGALPSGGNAPCHLALDEDANLLAVANYADGVVSIFQLTSSGKLDHLFCKLPGDGHGPNAQRQECSHAHQCTFIGSELWCCDLGTDTIRRYNKSTWQQIQPLHFPVGVGPRHLAKHPDGKTIYLVSELTSQLFTCKLVDGEYMHVSSCECLPEEIPKSSSSAAAVRLSEDEKYIFTSNRGYDSITVFEVDENSHLPINRSVHECEGRIPRDILPLGRYLLCACQGSDALLCMEWDGETFSIMDEVSIGMPVCIVRQP